MILASKGLRDPHQRGEGSTRPVVLEDVVERCEFAHAGIGAREQMGHAPIKAARVDLGRIPCRVIIERHHIAAAGGIILQQGDMKGILCWRVGRWIPDGATKTAYGWGRGKLEGGIGARNLRVDVLEDGLRKPWRLPTRLVIQHPESLHQRLEVEIAAE